MVRSANAEAAFEKRPRKQAEVAQHRELLPTKQADGSLKRQRVKLSKKEIAKQRRAESGSEKGKKKKSEKKAEKQASAAASKKRPTSEAALQKMASQVETSAMTLDEKKAAVARLSQRLLQAPHKNVKLLRQLHDLATRDPSAVVQRLALLSEVAVLRDVLPAYRQHPQPQPLPQPRPRPHPQPQPQPQPQPNPNPNAHPNPRPHPNPHPNPHRVSITPPPSAIPPRYLSPISPPYLP